MPIAKATVSRATFSDSSRFSGNATRTVTCLIFTNNCSTIPDHLKVLGDGTQRKSYLYIGDCVEAMLHVIARGTAKSGEASHVEIYNLGTDEFVQVNDSIRFICTALGVKPKLEYSGGNRAGWATIRLFFSTQKKFAPPAGKQR